MLLAALAVARTCGAHDKEVTQEEAIEIATKHVDFTPCTETGCVVVRALNQGFPPRLVWIVGLAEALDETGAPIRFESVIIDAGTGEIER